MGVEHDASIQTVAREYEQVDTASHMGVEKEHDASIQTVTRKH